MLTPVSTLRNCTWRERFNVSFDDQQSALMSLSAIADRVQLAPSSATCVAAAAATFSAAFIHGSQSDVVTAPIQV